MIETRARILALIVLAGCPGSSTEEPTSVPTPPSTEPTATAAPTGSASRHDVAGTWRSASCGPRDYERVLELSVDGTFRARDLVSPCPAGTRCIWSGIVEREGGWSAGESVVTLTVSTPGKPAGQPLPASLEISGGKLVEVAGAERCTYARSG